MSYLTYEDVKEPKYWDVRPSPAPNIGGLAGGDRLTFKSDMKIYRNGSPMPWATNCVFKKGGTIDATHAASGQLLYIVFNAATRTHLGTGPGGGSGTWTADEGP